MGTDRDDNDKVCSPVEAIRTTVHNLLKVAAVHLVLVGLSAAWLRWQNDQTWLRIQEHPKRDISGWDGLLPAILCLFCMLMSFCGSVAVMIEAVGKAFKNRKLSLALVVVLLWGVIVFVVAWLTKFVWSWAT